MAMWTCLLGALAEETQATKKSGPARCSECGKFKSRKKKNKNANQKRTSVENQKIGSTRATKSQSNRSTKPIDFTPVFSTDKGTVTEATMTFGPKPKATKPDNIGPQFSWTVGEGLDPFAKPNTEEAKPKNQQREQTLEFDNLFVHAKPSDNNGVDVRIRQKSDGNGSQPPRKTDPGVEPSPQPIPPREKQPTIDELEKLAEDYVKSRIDNIRNVGPADYDIKPKMIQDLISFSDTLPIFKGVVEVVARRETRNPIYNIFRWMIPRSSMQYLVGFREGGDPILIRNTNNDNGQAYSFLARTFRSLNKTVPIFPFLTEFFTTKGIPLTTVGGAGSIAALTLFSSSFTWTPVAIVGVVGVAWNVAGRVINNREKARLKAYNEIKSELEVRMQSGQGT